MPKRYPSDLTDRQWELVAPLFEPPRPKGGRPRAHPTRELLNREPGVVSVFRRAGRLACNRSGLQQLRNTALR